MFSFSRPTESRFFNLHQGKKEQEQELNMGPNSHFSWDSNVSPIEVPSDKDPLYNKLDRFFFENGVYSISNLGDLLSPENPYENFTTNFSRMYPKMYNEIHNFLVS